MDAVQQLHGRFADVRGDPGATLWILNEMDRFFDETLSLSSLLQVVHPDEDVRGASRQCFEAAAANATAIQVSRTVHDALTEVKEQQAKATSSEAASWMSEDARRYVSRSLDAFHRGGIGLLEGEEEKAFVSALLALRSRMTQLGNAFDGNLAQDRRWVWAVPLNASASLPSIDCTSSPSSVLEHSSAVEVVLNASMKGLPGDFLAARTRCVRLPGVVQAVPALVISTDGPDARPTMRYAADRTLRATLHLQSLRRGSPANLAILAELLSLRSQFAQHLAIALKDSSLPPPCSWAELSMQDKMARNPRNVSRFLKGVRDSAAQAVATTLATLQPLLAQEERERRGGEEESEGGGEGGEGVRVEAFDAEYFLGKLRANRTGLQPGEVRLYFTYPAVRRGVLNAAARLFGLRFQVRARPRLGEEERAAGPSPEKDICDNDLYLKTLPVCDTDEREPPSAQANPAPATMPKPTRWHHAVEVIDVYRASKELDPHQPPLGRIYLDMFPREGKYQHAAQFAIRSGAKTWVTPPAFGSLRHRHDAWPDPNLPRYDRLPQGALVCNFPSQGPMEHDDVVTFFHEFGHLMHHVLGGQDQQFVAFSGVATEWDFVETPSQLLESWAWDASVLRGFAARDQGNGTLLRLPTPTIAAMNEADALGRALSTAQQTFYASLSLALHDGTHVVNPKKEPDGVMPGAPNDTVRVGDLPGWHRPKPPSPLQSPCESVHHPPHATTLEAATDELQCTWSPYPHRDGTAFVANFGHLVGYDSNYYTYLWSQAIVQDLLSEIAPPVNVTAGDDPSLLRPAVQERVHRFRDVVLAQGGRRDAAAMLRSYLRRDLEMGGLQRWIEEDPLGRQD